MPTRDAAASPRDLGGGTVEQLRGEGFRSNEVGVVHVEQIGAVHDLEVRGVLDRELHVRHTDLEEAVGDARLQRRTEQLVSLGRDRGQQSGLVPEVMRGCRVRHADVARELAQADRSDAVGADRARARRRAARGAGCRGGTGGPAAPVMNVSYVTPRSGIWTLTR